MKIFNKFENVFRSELNKNFLTLFSGSAFAQIIPLIASIFLARIYPPEDFGVLAIFTSIIMIFSAVINLRYEFAIPISSNDKEAVTVSLLSGIVAILFSLLILIVIVIFKEDLLAKMGGENLGNGIYLIPFSLFLNGVFNTLNYFNLRLKEFKDIAASNVLRSSSGAILQVGFGYAGIKPWGLIFGYVLSFLFGNLKMFQNFWKYKTVLLSVSKDDLLSVSKRYKKFPLISIWGVLLNNISLNLNNFIIPKFFGMQNLGLYSYGFRNLSMPLNLISGNIGQVYYQKSIELKNNFSNQTSLFLSIAKKIIFITLPIFTFLFFFIEDLFEIIYGAEWRIAGTYSKILLPLFLIRSIYSPLSLLTIALEKQLMMVIFQVLIIIPNLLIVLICLYAKVSMTDFLLLYTYSSVFVYLLLLGLLYNLSRNPY